MGTTQGLLQFPLQLKLVTKFVANTFPLVERELSRWSNRVDVCPDQLLQLQAKASIAAKRFHAQGGSIYALYPGVEHQKFIPFIVALQTISDYLDNLCDRAGIEDEAAFRQVHLAMTEALCPEVPLSDYYLYYPRQKDGGYLRSLVMECRERVAGLPAYSLVKDEILKLAVLYSEMQTYKHLDIKVREEKLKFWAENHLQDYPELSCWEFGAAAGSTLGIFILCAAASNPHLTLKEVKQIREAYFPWITGLHILLDYFIDQEEDEEGGDLNFVSYYICREECSKRLALFLEQSLKKAGQLPHALFHRTVIQGLLAMYLSDPKTARGDVKHISEKLLASAGGRTAFLHKVCRILRQREVI